MTIFLLQRYYKFLIYTNNSSKKFTLFFQAPKSTYDDLCILIKYTSKDGDELIFRRKFFDETLAKCCRKMNVGETMQFAFEFEQWAKKLTLVRTETRIHHDCDFRVYECTYQGKRIELKAKDTAVYISYMIRVYDK